jgi:transposase-like protein
MVKRVTKVELEEMCEERGYEEVEEYCFNTFKENFTCPFCGSKHFKKGYEEMGDEFNWVAFRELKCNECNHFFTIEFPIDEE